MAGLAGRLFGEGACFCLGEYLGEFPYGCVCGEDYCCYENSGFGHLGVRFLIVLCAFLTMMVTTL